MFKLGRHPRKFNPRIPHLSSLMGGKILTIAQPPAAVDYSNKMTFPAGVFMNDTIGDCTAAAFYHARQVFSSQTGNEITDPTYDVLALYELSTGYVPTDPSTDNGGDEQAVLTYILNNGAPIGDGSSVDKLIAFVEVDVCNQDDIKTVINECGVCYIGVNMPQTLMDGMEPLWDYQTGDDTTSAGGHAVVLVGYDATGPFLISWGNKYQMTWAFFAQYVEEAYALIDNLWFNTAGGTVLGMTKQTLEALMEGIKE
jgi:hypothetical protein